MINGYLNERLGCSENYQKNDIRHLLKKEDLRVYDKNLTSDNINLYLVMLQGGDENDTILRSKMID